MQAALDRILQTYALLNSSAAADAVRDQLQRYLQTLHDGGETDVDRLTVCGLVYLRQQDGRLDPVKAGYTGM
ncbi:hypothetical protein BJ122_10567 [Rhodopseudomonas faecalis]|uniref:Uncharacterized protein n=1 Tax=Rhodopseudomonas faecalis TaxID=99655 RepID=A0A318TIZ4_9BRAD|nr:hypothetical protein [Rhodopseudomonas faecalis]PYF03810.1 hypothetical protein BJ122_10567 [Rhodopseudomonas faecalis]TAH68953.1 MAG: hypothetical protein EWM45_01470 [Rhodopseudomonas palustris]